MGIICLNSPLCINLHKFSSDNPTTLITEVYSSHLYSLSWRTRFTVETRSFHHFLPFITEARTFALVNSLLVRPLFHNVRRSKPLGVEGANSALVASVGDNGERHARLDNHHYEGLKEQIHKCVFPKSYFLFSSSALIFQIWDELS